jgi:hypothetical protein
VTLQVRALLLRRLAHGDEIVLGEHEVTIEVQQFIHHRMLSQGTVGFNRNVPGAPFPLTRRLLGLILRVKIHCKKSKWPSLTGSFQTGEIMHSPEHPAEKKPEDNSEKPRGSLKNRLKRTLTAVKEVMIGLTVHELTVELRKEKGQINNLFMLIVYGDLVGLPILPPYYSMRLLPYVVPHVERWKRSLLRERDITDLGSFDL